MHTGACLFLCLSSCVFKFDPIFIFTRFTLFRYEFHSIGFNFHLVRFLFQKTDEIKSVSTRLLYLFYTQIHKKNDSFFFFDKKNSTCVDS